MKVYYGVESMIVYLDHVRDKKELDKVVWEFRNDHPDLCVEVVPGSIQVGRIMTPSDWMEVGGLLAELEGLNAGRVENERT